jgi:hypothetical protein
LVIQTHMQPRIQQQCHQTGEAVNYSYLSIYSVLLYNIM